VHDETAAGAPTSLAGAQEEIAQLHQALHNRTVIGQATGLLMKELDLTAEAAFAHLVKLSSHANVKVKDVAARMVAEAEMRAAGGDPREMGR
jgi:AmiR/NasT family two-component response regulator